jgi:hypothetical protein
MSWLLESEGMQCFDAIRARSGGFKKQVHHEGHRQRHLRVFGSLDKFTRTLVDPENDCLQLRLSHLTEIGPYWEVAPDHSVDLLIGSVLPRRVEMGEQDIAFGLLKLA